MRVHRAIAAGAAFAVLLTAASVGAEPDGKAGGAAQAIAVRVLVPDQDPLSLGVAEAPPEATASSPTLVYPDDGSVVSTAAATETATATTEPSTSSNAAADIAELSLFGGEITADAIAARSHASAGSDGAVGDFDGAGLTNLVVLGQAIQPAPGLQVQLADWGHAILFEESTDLSGVPTPSYEGSLTVLDVYVDAAHGGLPAGSRIVVGYASASATSAVALPAPGTSVGETTPVPPPTTVQVRGKAPKHKRPRADVVRKARKAAAPLRPPEPDRLSNGRPSPFVLPPPHLRPQLTAGGYVFPVYGPSGYSDTFGAPRADVTWHHGDDIFAPLGAPILAVADGTVFSVGWNDIGGNRFWLRDGEGNEFYYAHLSAYSTLAINGARVHAGDVIGFVGNTGDAAGTPYHLHFEVHPVELLFLGYDGAVDPTPYLDGWRHLLDVRLRPAIGGGPSVVPVSQAPTPGAILLQSSDISTASGLEPGSMQRALAQPLTDDGNGALVPVSDLPRG